MTDSPWSVHIAYMTEHYGRRDTECVWCNRRVWMALQGFFAGGQWTTDPTEEGPSSG